MPTRAKQTPTTKTIDEFSELIDDGRLDLTPDFQRNAVWPSTAKAYLIDTMIHDMPIPLLFLSKQRDSNTNRLRYRVIDGQQRIRAAIAFLQNRLSIPNKYKVKGRSGQTLQRLRYRHLPETLKETFLGYSFVVMELSGYSEPELREIFVRINKYVVKLNPQEMRDAEEPGPFREFVDGLALEGVWSDLGLFSKGLVKRKRDKEFIAELAILSIEGPQDKKGSVDLYYGADTDQFSKSEGQALKKSLIEAARMAKELLAHDQTGIMRKLPAFYGFMGALCNIQVAEDGFQKLRKSRSRARKVFTDFTAVVASLSSLKPGEEIPKSIADDPLLEQAQSFRLSVSRQTDNLKPRTARIRVIEELLAHASRS